MINIKEVVLIYENPRCSGDLDLKTKLVKVPDDIHIKNVYTLYIKFKSGLIFDVKSFRSGSSPEQAMEIHGAMEKICTSNKDTLLNLKSNYNIVSDFARIKLGDMPKTNIEFIERFSDKGKTYFPDQGQDVQAFGESLSPGYSSLNNSGMVAKSPRV